MNTPKKCTISIITACILTLSANGQSPDIHYQFEDAQTVSNLGNLAGMSLELRDASGTAGAFVTAPHRGLGPFNDVAFDNRDASGMGFGSTGGVARTSSAPFPSTDLGSFTLCFWARDISTNNGNGARIFDFRSGTTGLEVLLNNNGQVRATLNGTVSADSQANLIQTGEQWQFVAVVFDGQVAPSEIRFYKGPFGGSVTLDRIVTVTVNTVLASSANLTIANSTASTENHRPYDGVLDNVRFYGNSADGAALTLAQIAAIKDNDEDSYWPDILPDVPWAQIAGTSFNEDLSTFDLGDLEVVAPADSPATGGASFSMPGLDGGVAAGSPVVFSASSTTYANESVLVAGDNLDGSRAFVYYIDSGAGVLSEATVMQTTDRSASVRLHTVLEAEMALLYLESVNGVGLPVRLNAPQTWWATPDRALEGDSITVYGANLLPPDSLAPKIYIRPFGSGSGTSSTACTVTAWNNNEITFTVPSGLTAGTDYEIWAHCGKGAQWGWGGPLRLSILASDPLAFAGTVLDVTSYGAVVDDGLDDYLAIQTAINTAQAGDRIYFPAGVYELSFHLNSPKALSFEGDVQAGAIIKTNSSAYNRSSMLTLSGFPSQVINLEFHNTSASPYMQGSLRVVGNGQSYFRAEDNKFYATEPDLSIAGIIVQDVAYGQILDNYFEVSRGLRAIACDQLICVDNAARGIGESYGSNAYYFRSCRNSVVADNHADNLDRPNGKAMKRAITTSTHQGSLYNVFYGSNTAIDVGPLPQDVDQNGGEVLLLENGITQFAGTPSVISGTTVTVSGQSWTPGLYAMEAWPSEHRGALLQVLAGTGAGQARKIIDNGSDWLEIDRPWGVEPDTSSIVLVTTSAYRNIIRDNTLGGVPDDNGNSIPDYDERIVASSGIMLWGNHVETLIESNTLTSARNGIYIGGLVSFYPNSDLKRFRSVFDTSIANNTVSSCKRGICYISQVDPSGSGDSGWGDVVVNTAILGNTIYDITEEGVVADRNLRFYYWDWSWNSGSLVDYNLIEDTQTAIEIAMQSVGATLTDNELRRTSYLSGSIGIDTSLADGDVYIDNNTIDSQNIDILMQ